VDAGLSAVGACRRACARLQCMSWYVAHQRLERVTSPRLPFGGHWPALHALSSS
jgi:hypothetical protein